jgi:hypothetical protein
MSCRFVEFSEHNLQLLMFGQTDTAELESVGLRPSVLSAFRASEFGFARALHFHALAVRRSFFDWFKRYGVASQRPIQIDSAVCSGTAEDEEIERALTTDAAATPGCGPCRQPTFRLDKQHSRSPA